MPSEGTSLPLKPESYQSTNNADETKQILEAGESKQQKQIPELHLLVKPRMVKILVGAIAVVAVVRAYIHGDLETPLYALKTGPCELQMLEEGQGVCCEGGVCKVSTTCSDAVLYTLPVGEGICACGPSILFQSTKGVCLPPDIEDGLKIKEFSSRCDQGDELVCAHIEYSEDRPAGCKVWQCEPIDDGGGCFSSESDIEVKGKGITPINEVRLGDYVKSKRDGSFSKVYALHKNYQTPTEFYQIRTETKTLELTRMHMLYIEGGSLPLAAKDVQVGDSLIVDQRESQVVLGVHKVIRIGFFSPVTEEGSIVVNDFVASSFTSFGNGSFVPNELVHHHTLSQIATAPVRFVCNFMWEGFCTNEDFLDDEGLHKYLVYSKKARHDMAVAPFILALGLIFSALEFIFHSNAILTAVTTMAALKITYISSKGRV